MSTGNTLHRGQFDGGLVLPGYKSLSHPETIEVLPTCKEYVIPLQQHIGEAGELLVKEGDHVLKGQCLAKPKQLISAAVHSPVSGYVSRIDKQPIPHPSGIEGICITIENDFKDEWVKRDAIGENYHQMTSHDLREKIRAGGIVGLGGAGFPSAVKQTELNIETLIINGAECEPYITCDDALMQRNATEIISGADIIGHIVKARECIIAIEDNKPAAISAIQAAIDEDGTGFFTLCIIETRYPGGGEKQLIKTVTNKEVPTNGLPADVDVLCHNVGTAYAIHKLVYEAEPLISRIVSVTGEGISNPKNIELYIGTTVSECIDYCGGKNQNFKQLLMGGPMMGIPLHTEQMPVIKTCNSLLLTTEESLHIPAQEKHMPCIRCGLCVNVCPARLLPQQLYWFSSSRQFEQATGHHLFDCIECGCCTYVCPSKIPLVQYYRFAKSEIWELEQDRKKSDRARMRHEQRTERLEKQKREREERLRNKRDRLKKTDGANAELDSKKKAIAEALARVNEKKKQQETAPKNTDNLSNEQQKLIDLVDERRKRNKQEKS